MVTGADPENLDIGGGGGGARGQTTPLPFKRLFQREETRGSPTRAVSVPLVPVVQRADIFIQRINRYPVNKIWIGWSTIYPLDRVNLFLNTWGPCLYGWLT